MIDFATVIEYQNSDSKAALCIVTKTSGSTPQKSGSKMIVIDNDTELGDIRGTIGGGKVEHEIRQKALDAIRKNSNHHITLSLGQDLGMCCGWTMTFFIEPIIQKPKCIILGAGHIGKSIASLALFAGFDIFVADNRKELLSSEKLPFSLQLIDDYSNYDLDKMPFGNNSFVIIATHSHTLDQELVEKTLNRKYKYLALIGSKRKKEMTIKRCLNNGFQIEDIKRLTCPAGLDINAKTPEEIAFSVISEMIQLKRKTYAS